MLLDLDHLLLDLLVLVLLVESLNVPRPRLN